jgi:hypothetical protein
MQTVIDFFYFLWCLISVVFTVVFGIVLFVLDVALWISIGGLVGYSLGTIARREHGH